MAECARFGQHLSIDRRSKSLKVRGCPSYWLGWGATERMAVAWSVIKAVLSLLKLQKGVLFFGMPKSVINAELADKIVPLAKIPSTVESFMRKSDSMNVVH